MAGVKGMKGGGGKRAGAGRPRKLEAQEKPQEKPIPVVTDDHDPLKFLIDVAFGQIMATSLQVRAAIAAVQYVHAKKGDAGKKDERKTAAKKAATGLFAPSAPPKLVAVAGRKH